MSNLTSEEVKLYENYELATPGQSLTNSPDQKYPWESPPRFTNRHDAELFILAQLTEEEIFLALMDMVGDGITDQAVLIVDRSIKPSHNSIVVATIDGEFVCKRLKLKPRMCLMPDNPEYPPIFINNGQELEIVGTVTAAINKF